MSPNPIRKALSSIRKHGVQFLLMGGQACVFYGAAEFSRDIDLAIFCESENLVCLQKALEELQAEVIAVPPFNAEFLKRGLAVHFRCHNPKASGLRIDIMSKMRGVEEFPILWQRRTTIQTNDGETIDILSIEDLVRAKKTQRDKDWPMIRRLVDSHFFQFMAERTPDRILFWLNELRTPDLIQKVLSESPEKIDPTQILRPWLLSLKHPSPEEIERNLKDEENREREADRNYWRPLKEELESLRRKRTPQKS